VTAHAASTAPVPADPGLLGRGLALFRIYYGIVLFANGLSKLFGFREIEIGPYSSFLITRPEARQILEFEVNRRGGDGTELPLLKPLVNDVILPNWGVFQWLVTAVELGVGAALIVGLATRLAALVGFGQQFFLQLVYLSSARWMFEQPHEWVPLLILALVPAGRVWGLDRRLVGRGTRRLDRWPF